MTELEELMQEPPGGGNHGRKATSVLFPQEGRTGRVGNGWSPLSAEEAQTEEYLLGGGWGVVDTQSRAAEAGMTVHRGVVHPDEHIDWDRVRGLVEDNLGCPLAEIEDVYRAGKPTAIRARTRAVIDTRLLALSRAGGNMLALARVLGWAIDEERGDCRMMRRALERARAAEAVGA